MGAVGILLSLRITSEMQLNNRIVKKRQERLIDRETKTIEQETDSRFHSFPQRARRGQAPAGLLSWTEEE